jgi:hypothetical protein
MRVVIDWLAEQYVLRNVQLFGFAKIYDWVSNKIYLSDLLRVDRN